MRERKKLTYDYRLKSVSHLAKIKIFGISMHIFVLMVVVVVG